MKVRSLVGLIPLLAVETLEPDVLAALPGFRRRLEWFVRNRPEFREHLEMAEHPGGGRAPAALHRVARAAAAGAAAGCSTRASSSRPTGSAPSPCTTATIRTCSPSTAGSTASTTSPRSRRTDLFGGNSNWRGPIWFPINYLLIEALQKFDHFYGPSFRVECPTGSGTGADPLGRRDRALPPPHPHLPARPGRTAAGPRRRRQVPDGPPLAGPHLVLRVLPRRQRRRHGREPSDRLDGARGEAPAAERRLGAVAGRRGMHEPGLHAEERRRHARGRAPPRPARLVPRGSEGGALAALRQHWPEYLIEAAGLGLFMISACLFAHPARAPGLAGPADGDGRHCCGGSRWGSRWERPPWPSSTPRWGQRSGAHLNPAVDADLLAPWARWRAGTRSSTSLAQFAGGIVGVGVAATALGAAARAPRRELRGHGPGCRAASGSPSAPSS